MGKMARFIDSLDAEQKDRIIQAQNWSKCGSSNPSVGYYDACLMEHAITAVEYWNDSINKYTWCGDRYDAAVRRFGLPRIIRACKLRAAKPQFILPSPQQSSKLKSSHQPVSGD